ncbi:hypothetical protein EW146_g1124 [Bondarzewia mesenterica]|uniref:Autophagy-related protein 101 n=1 Tax=Bondarzewia mesenterica TaxID=1095465 RepID=A0A4S4M5B3_9AGAM|nr:hypothetical protein EW146_g1124 [Bondarzewia mesenterica]
MTTTAMNTTHAIITIDIVLDRHNCREVLRALLHAILFHRLFGTVKPQTFDVLDVTIPGVADPDMERLVEEKVDMFWRGMENGAHRNGQLSVTFSRKDQKKKSWIGITYEEEVPWEQCPNLRKVFPSYALLTESDERPSHNFRAARVQFKTRLDAHRKPSHYARPHFFRARSHSCPTNHQPQHFPISDEDRRQGGRYGDRLKADLRRGGRYKSLYVYYYWSQDVVNLDVKGSGSQELDRGSECDVVVFRYDDAIPLSDPTATAILKDNPSQ